MRFTLEAELQQVFLSTHRQVELLDGLLTEARDKYDARKSAEGNTQARTSLPVALYHLIFVDIDRTLYCTRSSAQKSARKSSAVRPVFFLGCAHVHHTVFVCKSFGRIVQSRPDFRQPSFFVDVRREVKLVESVLGKQMLQ